MNLNIVAAPLFLICFTLTICIQFFFPLISYFLLVLLMVILFIKKGLIDYRVGFLGMISVYSFFPITNFFIFNTHDVGIGSYKSFALLESYDLNLKALQFVSYFCLGICMHIIFRKNKFINYLSELNGKGLLKENLSKYDWKLYISYILFFVTLLFLDWNRISSEYTLEGVSLTFFMSYFIFSIYAVFIATTGKLSISKVIPLFLIMAVFAYMGTRQTIFWGLLILFISQLIYQARIKTSLLSMTNIKRLTKYLAIISLIVTVFAITVSYRVNKDVGLIFTILNDLPLIFKLSFSLFLSETYYTFYNLLIVIHSSLDGYLPMSSLLNDFFIQMIPSQIFSNKYAYMDFINISREYELTPFGTWYIVGMIATVSFIPFISFIIGFIYCEIINLLSIFARKATSSLGEFSAFYAIIYVFCCFYAVRATIAGGLKMALSIFIIIILFKLVPQLYHFIQIKNGRKKKVL